MGVIGTPIDVTPVESTGVEATPIVVTTASLSSSSTYADAVAQYNDNLLWDGDVTKAQAALEAVRWIIVNRHKITKTDHREVEFEVNAMMDEKKKLEAYLDIADTSRRPRSSWVRGKMNYA